MTREKKNTTEMKKAKKRPRHLELAAILYDKVA